MGSPLYEKNETGVGFSFLKPAVYLEHWLNSWQGQKPLLDIGCGQGVNTTEALNRGACVVATDIELPAIPEHPSLTRTEARLPDVMPFSDNSFAGILCAEVFHFLPNEHIKLSLKELYRILQPGGTLLITCASCDIEVLSSTSLSQRVKRAWQTSPHQFQGQQNFMELITEAANDFGNPAITTPMIESYKQQIPGQNFNFFIPEQLANSMAVIGFTIDTYEQGPAPHYPVWSHGENDQVRILAKK